MFSPFLSLLIHLRIYELPGGVWTCPYTMESISVINYALGKTTYYPKGYIPPGALPPPKVEGEEEVKKKFDPDVLLTLTETGT